MSANVDFKLWCNWRMDRSFFNIFCLGLASSILYWVLYGIQKSIFLNGLFIKLGDQIIRGEASNPSKLLEHIILYVITNLGLFGIYLYIMQKWVVSLSCCDAPYSILETDVRWYAVGPGILRAPDTRATPPSSRHDRSSPLPSLG